MAQKKNKFGLSRQIPDKVKREIRRRSKNGCVNCRKGIFVYEHIDPEFWMANKHEPENMCLLCGSCEQKVTRGLLTKATIKEKYAAVQSEEVVGPHEFFDFVGDHAKLLIGGLVSEVSPQVLLEIDGKPLLQLLPRSHDKPAGIMATFNDETGHKIFSIQGNEWVGPTENYDLDTVGPRFEVRLPDGTLALKLDYCPPNTIRAQAIDMGSGVWHILASNNDIAVGRYLGVDSNLAWIHIKARVNTTTNYNCLISCLTKSLYRVSKSEFLGIFENPWILVNQDGTIDGVHSTVPERRIPHTALYGGISWPDLGLVICKGTSFALAGICVGICSLKHARYNFFRVRL